MSNTLKGRREEPVCPGSLAFLLGSCFPAYLKQFMGRDAYPGQPRLPATIHGFSYTNNNPVNFVDPSGLLRCQYSSSGCSDWVVSTLDAIESNPNPIGKQLVDALWAKDDDLKFIQWLAFECFDPNESPSTQPGFRIIFTDTLPWPSGAADMATRPTSIYIKTKFIKPPKYIPPGPPDDGTLLLFAHELVHVKQGSLFAASIYGEVQAYQIEAVLRDALGLPLKASGTLEGDAIDVNLNNPNNLLADLDQWRSDHSAIYGIVPLLPAGYSELVDPSSTGPTPMTQFWIDQFQQLFPTLASQVSRLKSSTPTGTTPPGTTNAPNPPSPCPPTPCTP